MSVFGILKQNGVKIIVDSPKPIYEVSGNNGSLSLEPNVFYKFTDILDSLSFTLEAGEEDFTAEYHLLFDSGDTPTTVNYPAGLYFPDGEIPNIEANKRYEFHIFENCLVWKSYSQ